MGNELIESNLKEIEGWWINQSKFIAISEYITGETWTVHLRDTVNNILVDTFCTVNEAKTYAFELTHNILFDYEAKPLAAHGYRKLLLGLESDLQKQMTSMTILTPAQCDVIEALLIVTGRAIDKECENHGINFRN